MLRDVLASLRQIDAPVNSNDQPDRYGLGAASVTDVSLKYLDEPMRYRFFAFKQVICKV